MKQGSDPDIREKIQDLVAEGLSTNEIAEQLNVTPPNVAYHKRMIKLGKGVKKEKKKEPEYDVSGIVQDLDAEDDPLSEDDERDLAEEVEKLWVWENKDPESVCRELFISLRRLSYIIKKYKISKSR